MKREIEFRGKTAKSVVVEIKDFEIRCDIDGVKHRLEYETVYEVIGNIFDKESNNGNYKA